MSFDAFMSYSHSADDQLAPSLQRAMQRLAKPWYRARALRVFRDDASLSANPHLWSSIRDALDESQWFVLLASPDAAASSWVDRELRHWLAAKPVDRILVAVTDGECHWDPATRQLSGNATPIAITDAFDDEPRLVDLRWARTAVDLDMRNPRFRDAAAQLAAPAHGVAKDELDSEDLRLQRRARRLAQGATTLLALLVVISLTLGGLARQQRNAAKKAARTARQAQAAAEAESLRSDAQRLGTQALTEPNLDRSLLLAVAGVDLADLPETRGDLLAILQKTPAVIRHVAPSHNEIVAVASSPDGRLLASADSAGVLRFTDLRTWKPVGPAVVLPGPVFPQAMAYSPDGTHLAVSVASSGTRSDLYFVDAAARSARLVKSWPSVPAVAGPLRFTHLAFSPNGDRLAIAIATATPAAPLPTAERLAVLQARTGRPDWDVAYPLRAGQQETYVAFAPTGALVTSSPQGETLLWNTATGSIERRFPDGGIPAVSPDGGVVALAENSADPTQPRSSMAILDLRTGALRSLEPVPARAWIVASLFTRDGKNIVGGSFEGAVRVWDRTSGSIVQTFAGQPSGVSVALTPDGRTLVSGAKTGSVAAWDVSGSQRLGKTFQWGSPDEGCPTTPCFVVDPQSTVMAVSESGGTVGLIDLRTRQLSRTLAARNGEEADALAFSPDGRVLATGGVNGRVTLWNVRTASVARTLEMQDPVWLVAVSPDGKRLAAETQSQNQPQARVQVVDLTTGKTLFRHDLPNGHRGLQFSPDGRALAVLGCCQPASTIEVWDARTGRTRFRPRVEGRVTSIAYSPDRRVLAAGTEDGKVVFLNAGDGRQLGSPMLVASGALDPISFSPDGRLLAASSADQTTTLWDVESRKRIGESFPVEQGVIPAAHFAPDGNLLIDYLADAARWPTSVEAWKRYACQVAGRELSPTEWSDLLPNRPYRSVCDAA